MEFPSSSRIVELRSLRTQTVAFASLAIAVGLFAGREVARSSSLSSPALLALLAIAGVTILLSIPPTVLFIAWLALAPLLQNSASHTAIGNPLQLALYLGPPLIFLLWSLASSRSHAPSFIDFVPLAYFLLLLGSMFVTSDVTVNALRDLYGQYAIGIIVYYLVAFGPLRSNVRERVVAVVLTLATIEALMSIVDGLTGWNLWHDTGWQGSDVAISRAVATLALPGVLGSFIGIGVLLAIALLVWQGPRQLRWLAVVTIVVGFPGMYFTLTRGPIIAIIAVGFLVLVTRPGTRVLAFVSLLLATAVLGSTWSRISDSTLYRERATRANTLEIRLQLERLSLQLAEKRPILGWGYGSFDRVKHLGNLGNLGSGSASRNLRSLGPESISRDEVLGSTSHNTFLTVLVEEGAIGLGLLLVPWLVICWRSLGDSIRHPDARWFLVGSLAVVAGNTIAQTTYDARFFSLVPALTWLFLGLMRRHQLDLRE
jgi:O-antigen ligase